MVLGQPLKPFRFADVSRAVGINPPKRDKVAGPSIVDLNQDGFMDIVVGNHARDPVDVYYGSRNGSFSVMPAFVRKGDRHGTAVGDIDLNGYPDIIVSIGNRGTYPPLRIEYSSPSGALKLGRYGAQGFYGLEYLFDVRLVDLDGDGDLDIFATGAFDRMQQHVWRNTGSSTRRFRKVTTNAVKPILFPIFDPFVYGFLVFDYNGDGINDILLMSNGIRIFRGGPNFEFRNVSTEVLPSTYDGKIFNSAAAFDMDNDGDLDIYITGGIKLKGKGRSGLDLLFENRNGVFVDISTGSFLPKKGIRPGIAAGDFDNDGFIDLYLPHARPGSKSQRAIDIMLRNTGNKSFVSYRNHGALGSRGNDLTYPTGAQPIDFDRDGQLDIVVTTRFNQGNSSNIDGSVFLFRNIIRNSNNYFVVKVPVVIRGRVTTDAILELKTSQTTLFRRVGGEGEGRVQSFNNQVHFGIGRSQQVRSVTLKLLRGPTYLNTLVGVPVNGIYDFVV